MAPEERWTIRELLELVADNLEVDYPGPPTGRVREVPDRRTVRWYTTIGLLDRPVAMRGRTALYGRRHLLQLVAIKRLQAAGLTLAEIQQRLYGATDSTLNDMAHLSAVTKHTSAEMSSMYPLALAKRLPPVPPVYRDWDPLEPASTSVLVHGIALGDSVTVMVPSGARPLTADDLAAIHEAAGPLLAVLRQRGLTRSEGNAHDAAR